MEKIILRKWERKDWKQDMPIQIHNKTYITVAERVQEAGADFISLNTEVLQFEPIVVLKATVVTKKGTFSGISAANPAKAIEKMSPYEVAETSAVGRALGFAGYGIVDSIASADEIVKATTAFKEGYTDVTESAKTCSIHKKPMLRGISKTKLDKEGQPKKYWYHIDADKAMCFGNEEK